MIDFKNPLLKCYMCTVCLSSHRLQYASGYKPGIEKKKKEKVNVCTLLGVPSHQTVLGAIIVLVEKD